MAFLGTMALNRERMDEGRFEDCVKLKLEHPNVTVRCDRTFIEVMLNEVARLRPLILQRFLSICAQREGTMRAQ